MRPVLSLVLTLGACAPDIHLGSKDDDPVVVDDSDDAVAVGQPDIEVGVSALAFGTVGPGCPTSRTVAVGNVGDRRLEIGHLGVDGADQPAFTLDGAPTLPLRLRPGEWVDLTLTLSSEALGPLDDATFTIRSDDPDEPTTTVALTGEVMGPAAVEQIELQNQPVPVDLLWVVDYSCSMETELEELGNHLPGFLRDFADLGLDWRMAVTGAGENCGEAYGPVLDASMAVDAVITSFDAQTLGVLRGGDGCVQEQGFGGASAFVVTHPDFLRPDANFAVVVVADEEDQTYVPVRTFTTWLAGLKGGDATRVSFSGMVGPRVGLPLCDACPLGSHPEADACISPLYHAAIDQTDGAWGDLCSFDFAPMLTHLSRRASGLWVRVALTHRPADPLSIVVTTLDGAAVPRRGRDGWTYDAGRNVIEFHGAAIPGAGGGVTIAYTPVATCPVPSP